MAEKKKRRTKSIMEMLTDAVLKHAGAMDKRAARRAAEKQRFDNAIENPRKLKQKNSKAKP